MDFELPLLVPLPEQSFRKASFRVEDELISRTFFGISGDMFTVPPGNYQGIFAGKKTWGWDLGIKCADNRYACFLEKETAIGSCEIRDAVNAVATISFDAGVYVIKHKKLKKKEREFGYTYQHLKDFLTDSVAEGFAQILSRTNDIAPSGYFADLWRARFNYVKLLLVGESGSPAPLPLRSAALAASLAFDRDFQHLSSVSQILPDNRGCKVLLADGPNESKERMLFNLLLMDNVLSVKSACIALLLSFGSPVVGIVECLKHIDEPLELLGVISVLPLLSVGYGPECWQIANFVSGRLVWLSESRNASDVAQCLEIFGLVVCLMSAIDGSVGAQEQAFFSLCQTIRSFEHIKAFCVTAGSGMESPRIVKMLADSANLSDLALNVKRGDNAKIKMELRSLLLTLWQTAAEYPISFQAAKALTVVYSAEELREIVPPGAQYSAFALAGRLLIWRRDGGLDHLLANKKEKEQTPVDLVVKSVLLRCCEQHEVSDGDLAVIRQTIKGLRAARALSRVENEVQALLSIPTACAFACEVLVKDLDKPDVVCQQILQKDIAAPKWVYHEVLNKRPTPSVIEFLLRPQSIVWKHADLLQELIEEAKKSCDPSLPPLLRIAAAAGVAADEMNTATEVIDQKLVERSQVVKRAIFAGNIRKKSGWNRWLERELVVGSETLYYFQPDVNSPAKGIFNISQCYLLPDTAKEIRFKPSVDSKEYRFEFSSQEDKSIVLSHFKTLMKNEK